MTASARAPTWTGRWSVADLVIRPRVGGAVAAAQARGVVIVVIATGRMYRSTLRFARALDLAPR